MMNVDYCTKLFQQQIGSARWKQHDDVVKFFRCSEENFLQYIPRGTKEQLVVCKFAPVSTKSVLLLVSRSGRVELHDTKNKEVLLNFWALAGPIYDVAWIPGKLQIVVPSKHSKMKLWDISGPRVTEIFDFVECGETSKISNEPVTSIDTCKEDPHVFATGGMDNVIVLWDTRIRAKIGAIYKAHRRKNTLLRRTVSGLAFRHRSSLISCGENDQCIKMWDMRNLRYSYATGETKCKCSFVYKGEWSGRAGVGFSSVVIDDNRRMYTNCTDGRIYSYNISRTCPSQPMMKYTYFRTDSVLSTYVTSHTRLALSKDGIYLANGYNGESTYIWNTNFSYPIVRLHQNSSVMHVAWHQTNNVDHTVFTCSGSESRTIWRISSDGAEQKALRDNASSSKVDVFPPVYHQLRLKNVGNLINTALKPCRKCFSASKDEHCDKCKNSRRLKHCYDLEKLGFC